MEEEDQSRGDSSLAPASYGLELKALSLREMARLAHIAFLPIFLVIKVFRIPVKKRFGLRYPVVVTRLQPPELSDEARRTLEAASERWAELGFGGPMLLNLGTTGCQEMTAALAVHRAQAITATTLLAQVTLESGQRINEEIHACASQGEDGRIITTLSAPRKLEAPPEADRLHVAGASPEALLARHRDRVPASALSAPPPDENEVLTRFERVNNREIEFHAARGVYVAIPEEKVPDDPEGSGLCDRCGDRSALRRRFLDQDLCPSCIARVARVKKAATFKTMGLALAAILVGVAALLATRSLLGASIIRRLGGGPQAETLAQVSFLLVALIFLLVVLALAGRSLARQKKR